MFSPTGLFHATEQTAAYLAIGERETFVVLLVAFACADRFGWTQSRTRVRWIGLAVGAWVALLIYAAIAAPLPLVIVNGHATALWYRVIVPVNIVTALLAIGILAASGLRTVTQVWMIVVALIYACETISNAIFSGGRYSLGWYTGRTFVLVGAGVLLAVFMVKINDLLFRLTRRNSALAERTELAELEAAEGEQRYRSLTNVVPQLIWTANADGEIDYVNDRWVTYTGYDVRETRERGWHAALDELGGATVRGSWQARLAEGRGFGGEYRLRETGTGRLRWFLIDIIPLHDDGGTIVRWIGASTDIDRSKRTEEREAFLAAAGDRLSASLDLDATRATISDLIVGSLASWARVDLLEEEGRFENVGIVLERMFTAVLAGRDVVVQRDFNGSGALFVPLISGDVPLGVLTLGLAGDEQPDDDEIAVARDFGRRAAQALDHAQRYERERATADSFQRAMLPQAMPQLDNVSFSASYSAASETRRVGGDFYDAFVLPDGRVALTIGDVTGHGLEAAVIMGEVRQSLRAAASFDDVSPSSILDRASRLLLGSGRGVFVTAVFGVLDTQTGVFEYATAGHPSPIVSDGVSVMRLTASGLPIGLREDEGVDFATTLPAQCTIVLYTDGLIEFARDLDEGERRLDEAIAALTGGAETDVAGEIMRSVLGTDRATDDIAILTATIDSLPAPAPEPFRRWRFSSNDNRTGVIVRHEVGRLVTVWSADRTRRYDAELAFGEMFANVVRHAPGLVTVELADTARGAELRVTDRGPGLREPSGSAEMFAESGRGLQLVRAVSDGVEIAVHAGGGTTVTVVFAHAERDDSPWRTFAQQGENVGR